MLNKHILMVLLFFAPLVSKAQIKAGDTAPEIHITNWLKNAPKSQNLKGKFVIIDFWATWCAPCLESVPHMNNLAEKNTPRSNLVFLALTNEKVDKVNFLLKRLPFSSAVVTDTTNQTWENFKVNSIPLLVIIDDKNMVRWVGHSAGLTNEIITNVLDGKNLPVTQKQQEPTDEEVQKMYKALYKKYRQYIDDEDVKEYFSMGPVLAQKYGSNFSRTGTKRPYQEIAVGISLIEKLAKFLDVSTVQMHLPNEIAQTYFSYCYKSAEKNTKQDVLDALLKGLKLKYVVTDSLINAIQLRVTDEEKLQKHLADDLAHISRASNSDAYAAILYNRFSVLTQFIQEKFKTVVKTEYNPMLDKNMSITIKIDNLKDMETSLKEYGISLALTKTKVPVYNFYKVK